MAEDSSTTTPEDTTSQATDPTDTSATDTLGDGGKKALESERRAKRNAEKRAADLEARLKEFEDRDKTESQRLGEATEAERKRADAAESRALRLEVASDKGLTAAQAKRLVGSTREELEADAEELLTTFKPAENKDDNGTAAVAASLDLGARGNSSTPAQDVGANWLTNLIRQ